VKYLLSVYQPDGPVPSQDVLARIMRDVAAIRAEMQAAGVWVFAAGLEAADSAAVARSSGEAVLVTDGPYIESKEHLGGFTLIEVSDRAAALSWARKLSRATTLPIEVRACREQL